MSLPNPNPLLFLTLLLLLCRCSPSVNPTSEANADELPVPELTNLDGQRIAQAKAGAGAQDKRWEPAYRRLIDAADSLLTAPLYAVTQKTQLPPSGDKHDYLSLAPYWWPDPEREDGLPWIRRDGEVNPRTRGLDVDVTARRNALGNFFELSLAAYFSDRQAYADRAREQLRTWFIDPETRMNPHLEYAQGIPGRNDGRCYGIIEFRAIMEVITGVELLQHLGELTADERAAFDEWTDAYANWLMTSELGREESARHNNHGTWYDAQLVSMLRFLGREEEARTVLEKAKTERIAAHLAADGSQPEEIERTKSLSYSTMNLEGLTILAYHARRM
ncbi:MAG: alginate lyase family protein, partial [Lewinella sp.]